MPSIDGKTFSINVSAPRVCYFVHRSLVTSRSVLFLSPSSASASAPYTITRSEFNLISISVSFFNGNRIRVSTIHDVKWAERNSVSERFPRKNVCFFFGRGQNDSLNIFYIQLTVWLVSLFIFTSDVCLRTYFYFYLYFIPRWRPVSACM